MGEGNRLQSYTVVYEKLKAHRDIKNYMHIKATKIAVRGIESLGINFFDDFRVTGSRLFNEMSQNLALLSKIQRTKNGFPTEL